MKRINFKAVFVAMAVIGLIVAAEYADYITYKTKFPNTTLWMWVLDNK